MKKLLPFLLLYCLFPLSMLATHQRAAEIIYTHVGGLTYQIKIITYTNNNIANDSRDYLPILWGDGKSDDIKRITKNIIGTGLFGEQIVYNEYIAEHTYPAIGTYTLSLEDPNRNEGVANIPNSVDVPIYIESELVINPFIGGNNSVQLLNRPLDYGCVGNVFVHNPGAYDIDGDSLSYKLIKCRGADGEVIPGYKFPDQVLPDPDNDFYVDPQSGNVFWDVPNLQGTFNIAIQVEEWRKGVKIGSVVRDMQVQITTCTGSPPVIESINDTCITAGQLLEFDITAYSMEGDIVSITATGGPFESESSPAYLDPDPAISDSLVETTFTWQTNCDHIQNYPYQVYIKATDKDNFISQVTYKTVNIQVVAPPVEITSAEPLGNTIQIEWTPSECDNAIGYMIYRRNGFSGFEPGYCETGVPYYTGYQLINQVSGVNNTQYVDDGLAHGVQYCYIVVAYYQDGSESYASNEACASLLRDLPVITNVSNDSSSNLNGEIYLAWSRPIDLDTSQYPGPYQYKIYRAEQLIGDNFTQIATAFGLNDTIYFDRDVNINNENFPYRYRVDLLSETIGDIGPSPAASSMYLSIYETDEELRLSWDFDVTWLNERFVIFRKDPGSDVFTAIDTTIFPRYNDKGLTNETEYCYYIESIGTYNTPGLIEPIVNFSQKSCGIPYDNVPPCSPDLSVYPDCLDISNLLVWSNPVNDSCDRDIEKYLIYYTSSPESNMYLIDSTLQREDTTYIHSNIPSVIGCYSVQAVDSLGNISLPSEIVCADTLCGGFKLPNVFTPNGDQWNQYFQAFPGSLGAVDRIDLVVFNRYGRRVFETKDKFFRWDGTNMENGQALPEAVYFFVCDVYEYSLEGINQRNIKGSVTLLR